ncbi:MAG: hypothetical protein KC635_10860 [Myxococcales bacterium]|nr:hypothetical protein [Myxococcales bacterium]
MASRARALVASFALLGAGGCVAEGGAPLTSDDGGGHVAVSVAALSLPGVHDAVWDLRVATGASAETTVVTKRLTASGYGDGVASASYVAPCDASAVGDNTVELRLIGIYNATVADAGAYGDPAPGGKLDAVDPGLLAKKATCAPNGDTPVRFDVAVMRPANQGFFDVAVSFEDVFCSAKYDCDGEPLLYDGAARGATHVLGLACSAGATADAATRLHLTNVTVDCGVNGVATVDPASGTGNLCTSGATASCAPRVTDPSGLLFQAAVFQGVDDLPGQDVRYWNVALGVATASLDACTVRARATADDGSLGDEPVAVAAGAVYPYIDWAVPLVGCPASFPVATDGSAAPVAVAYTTTSATDPTPFAHTFGPAATPAPAPGGLVMYLDAGDAASYAGAGEQLWKNLVAAPADGRAQADYDFQLGPSSGTGDDPGFHGVAGQKSANEYFTFGGGLRFILASGANTPFINSIHKDGARYTMVLWVRTPASFGPYGNYLGTGGWSPGNPGFLYSFRNGPFHQLSVLLYSQGVMAAIGAAPSASAVYMMAASVDEPAGTGFLYLNGAYDPVSGSDTFDATYVNPPTSDSGCAMEIGNAGCGVGDNYLPADARVYAVRIFNRALTKAEMDAEWALMRGRFGL